MHALSQSRLPTLLFSPQVGWKHAETVKELEAKRKAKSAKFYEVKKKRVALRAKAVAKVEATK